MDVANKLLDLFKSLKGGTDGTKNKAGVILAALTGIVALTVIAILSFRAWRMGKKLAKLQHEKDVADEKAEQAVADAMIAESEEEKQAAQAQIEEIRKRLLEIAVATQEAQTTYDQAKESINEIETWEDFDNRGNK